MENKDYKIINVHYFNPAEKTVRERLEIIYCHNSENCNLLKQNKCVNKRFFLGSIKCPYGKFSSQEGYTRKAKAFYNMKTNAVDKYKELIDCIDFSVEKLTIIGEYVFLPYPHLKNYVNAINGIIDEHFILLLDFTNKKILEIINFKPQALMGGEIKDFQNKEVPRFISHLKEELPDVWKSFCTEYPDKAKEFEKDVNYIGRTAYLKTLAQNCKLIDYDKRAFVFDGEYLLCKEWSSAFVPFNAKSCEIKIKADDKMVFKITDNNQVCKTTKFKD